MSSGPLDPAAIASAAPPAGVGIVAAHAISLAAGVEESLARTAVETSPVARGIAVQAAHVRSRAESASAASAAAYATARERLRPADGAIGTGRDAMLRASLLASADALVAILAAAADCAALAAALAEEITPDLRPDATGTAWLAAGAAEAVAGLVDVNLGLGRADPRRATAAELLAAAHASVAEAQRAQLG